MDHNCLIYRNAAGEFIVEDRNRIRVAGCPCSSEADAERVAINHAGCMALVRASQEATRRICGNDYIPD